jgi:glycosyltransferase involved in cell wall biosynthesis
LLIEVSVTADAKRVSGIQRAVISLVSALLRQADDLPFEPVPISYAYRQMCFVEARQFAAGLFGQVAQDAPLSLRPGDIVLMLDSTWHFYPIFAKHFFPLLRMLKGAVVTCVYDLIPVTHPEFFERHTRDMFTRWFRLAARESDLIVSISAATMAVVAQEMAFHRRQNLPLCYFHLGADFHDGGAAMPDDPFGVASGPLFLMVATFEPRKGHEVVLDAVETLWRDGVDARLAIIGGRGWFMEPFLRRLESHPERNRRLLVFHQAADDFLRAAYMHCDALIAASVVEGFGLPLIEAARFGKALIASDIPAFREICRERAIYFAPGDSAQLAEVLRSWTARAHDRSPIDWISWDQSARMLVDRIERHLFSSPPIASHDAGR